VAERDPGLRASDGPLVEVYDGALLDLDGVVYVGRHAVDGVPDLLAKLRDAGVRLAFVTNNASRTAAGVAEHLRELGIDADEADVVTSAQAAAHETARLVGRDSAVLLVGGEGLSVALQHEGLRVVQSADDEPAAVVQGFHPRVGWELLAEGAFAIENGAAWVASNLDLTFPTSRGVAPGNGTLVNALAAAVGRRPDCVAGKPYRPLFDEAVRRLDVRRPLVVGDRLDTDIAGAHSADLDSLLVMTGVTDLSTLCRADAEHRPSFLGWTMDALVRAHGVPERREDGWVLGGWRVRCDGAVSIDDRDGDDDDGLRAVAAAAWDWADRNDPADIDVARAEGLWSNR